MAILHKLTISRSHESNQNYFILYKSCYILHLKTIFYCFLVYKSTFWYFYVLSRILVAFPYFGCFPVFICTVIFQAYLVLDKNCCQQTEETLIRCHMMRRLIWVYTVWLCTPFRASRQQWVNWQVKFNNDLLNLAIMDKLVINCLPESKGSKQNMFSHQN